jgi:dihydropyrimidine dehydrogenase (NADP+)
MPGYPILATGGCDSADVGLQFLHAGAHAVQVCSAVQNQDFTVINDYTSGLKAMLYAKSRGDLAGYNGLSPPTPKHQMGKPLQVGSQDGKLPFFGDFERSRQKMVSEISRRGDDVYVQAMDTVSGVQDNRPAPPQTAEVPTIADVIGLAVPNIGSWGELAIPGKEQVVALVDPDLCINCGKCYMTCNDSGYQAITFDKETHIPFITDECTGCTLCVSVCPVIDCIDMVPREGDYQPKRGVEFGDDPMPESEFMPYHAPDFKEYCIQRHAENAAVGK